MRRDSPVCLRQLSWRQSSICASYTGVDAWGADAIPRLRATMELPVQRAELLRQSGRRVPKKGLE